MNLLHCGMSAQDLFDQDAVPDWLEPSWLSQLPGIRTVSLSFPSLTTAGLQCSTNPSILMTFIFLDCCEIWSRQSNSPQDGLKWIWWSLQECSANWVCRLCNCEDGSWCNLTKDFFTFWNVLQWKLIAGYCSQCESPAELLGQHQNLQHGGEIQISIASPGRINLNTNSDYIQTNDFT